MAITRFLRLLLCLLILAVTIISLWISPLPIENLWALQVKGNTFTLGTDMLEELSGKTAFSFQNHSEAPVEALGSTTTMKVIHTNPDLPYLLPYPTLSGVFALEEDWVVLNKLAAHKLFYNENIQEESLRLEGKGKKIVGVIDDGAKEARLYTLPLKGNVVLTQLLFSSTKDHPLSRSELTSYLQILGLDGKPYRLINLSQSWLAAKNLPLIFLLLIGAYFIISLLKKLLKTAKRYKEDWKKAEEYYSFREWLAKEDGLIGKFLVLAFGLIITITAGIVVVVIIFSRLAPHIASISQMYYFAPDSFPSWAAQFKQLFFLQLALFFLGFLLFLIPKNKAEEVVPLPPQD